MAMTEIDIAATPEQVFAVLSDPDRYEEWVAGTTETHGAGDDWPEEGAKLQWEAGVGPLKLKDVTEVRESDPPRRLLLVAKVRPLGEALIDIHVDRTESGSRVTLFERPTDGVVEKLDNPVTDSALHARNVASLERLKEIVERDASA